MNRNNVFDVIKNCVLEILPDLATHKFEDSDSLEALGANSMNKADIVMLALEELALAIPRIEAFGPKSIGELTDLLHGKMA